MGSALLLVVGILLSMSIASAIDVALLRCQGPNCRGNQDGEITVLDHPEYQAFTWFYVDQDCGRWEACDLAKDLFTKSYNGMYAGAACKQTATTYVNTIRNAFNFNPATPVNETFAEKCQYMNFVIPKLLPNETFGSFPVHVFAHGGGGAAGTGNYDFRALAVSQRLITVSFNYRLNALGSIPIPVTDEPASNVIHNYGLSDAATAMVAVRKNVEFVGGNSSNIILNGESQGATIVELLLRYASYPRDQLPFDSTVTQSTYHSVNLPTVRAIPTGAQYIDAVKIALGTGCMTTVVSNISVPRSVRECMRAKSYEEIMAALGTVNLLGFRHNRIHCQDRRCARVFPLRTEQGNAGGLLCNRVSHTT